MEGSMNYQDGTPRHLIRAAAWGGAGLLLLTPLIAMQFTDEVRWGVGDFLIFGGMLSALGLGFEGALRLSKDTLHLVAMGVGLVTTFFLVWVNGAVGIIGAEGSAANLMYGGVLAIPMFGSLRTRLRPKGMVRVMVMTALAQGLVGAIALAMGPGAGENIWPWDVIVASAAFMGMWLASACVFWLSQ